MNLDVRIPIGLMFSLFGGVLVFFGAVSDPKIYDEHSLGININLYWGVVLLLFGAAMLCLAWRGRGKWQAAEQPKAEGKSEVPSGPARH